MTRSTLPTLTARRFPAALAALAALVAAPLLSGCDDAKPTAPAASSTAAPAPTPAASDATTTAKTAAASGPTASAAPPAVSASAAPAKAFDCGAKGQKPCPMQGWMKKVMASASSSGEGEPLAKALGYVADHPPPGYGEWAGFARAGLAKAKAGDVDGAKATCKQCHDAYKEKYKAEMRDRPF